jgi:uncharacterized membrane protein
MKTQTNLGGKNSCVFFSIFNWVIFSFEDQTVLCKWEKKKKKLQHANYLDEEYIDFLKEKYPTLKIKMKKNSRKKKNRSSKFNCML